MPLWIDSDYPHWRDLAQVDGGLAEVGSLDWSGPAEKALMARREISGRLEHFLEIHAVPETGLDHVAMTEPLRRWVTLQSLAYIYRDAYFQQLSERWKVKWREFQKRAEESGKEFFETGVAVVANPVPRPLPPVLAEVPGELETGTYYVVTAYVGDMGQEGQASLPAAIGVSVSGGIAVQSPLGREGLTGWRVYAGPALDTLRRQGPPLIALSESLIVVQLSAGTSPTEGQGPDRKIRANGRLLRG